MFEDFLEMVVCALSLGAKEYRYLEIVRNCEKPDAYLMSEAFGALVMEMDNNGQGLKDCFGNFYMEYISHGHNGQFFTPEPVCEIMARISNPAGFGMFGSKKHLWVNFVRILRYIKQLCQRTCPGPGISDSHSLEKNRVVGVDS